MDYIALAVFIVCFAVYHILYYFISERYPKTAVKAYVGILREKGIENLLKKEDYQTIIQQLRDAMQVSNIFASSSLIFIGLLLNLLIHIDKITQNLQITNVVAFEFKILFITAVQAVSFIFFVSSIRYYRIASLLSATPPEEIEKHLGISATKYFAFLLDRGCAYYTLGSRGLLYSVLSLAWFVSDVFFIAIVVITTILLAKYRDFTRFQEV